MIITVSPPRRKHDPGDRSIIKLGLLVKNYGISVMLIGLLLRLILMPLSAKTIKQSENMKKAQPEIERLERKYKDKTDSESMMQKSQETMLIYKKYNINPMGGCLVSFIQLPLFIAFLCLDFLYVFLLCFDNITYLICYLFVDSFYIEC